MLPRLLLQRAQGSETAAHVSSLEATRHNLALEVSATRTLPHPPRCTGAVPAIDIDRNDGAFLLAGGAVRLRKRSSRPGGWSFVC